MEKNNNNKNITLKEYFDTRFNELRNYIDIKFNAMDKASCLAQENLNTRLEHLNEFRDSLKDQTANYVTLAEYNSTKIQRDSDIRMLREANAEMKGKASQQSVIAAYVIAIVGIIIGVIGLLMKKI